MNERIKKIAEEAGMVIVNDQFSTYGKFAEKFAELIVRECIHNMENCDGDLDFAIWKTKKDFGIDG